MMGSGRAVQDTNYYSLNGSVTKQYIPVNEKPWPVHVSFSDFSISEIYKQNEIVYRQSAQQLRYYSFERWSVKPEYLVSEKVFQNIRSMNIFQEFTQSTLIDSTDYSLTGEVLAIEEFDSLGLWYAHISMSMHLRENQNQLEVWSHSWNTKKVVEIHTPALVVSKLSDILDVISNEAAAEMDQYFAMPKTIKKEI